MLYRLLFQTAVSLDLAARTREAAGHDASALRQYFVHRGNLTQGQSGVVFQIAEDAARAESADIAQEKKLVADWRAQSKSGAALGNAPPPTPLAQMKKLQADRDAIAMRERDQLHLLLGDDGFNQLEIYVHGHFGAARQLSLPVPSAAGGAANGGGQ